MNRLAPAIAALLALAALNVPHALAQGSPSTTPARGAEKPADVQGDGRQQAEDLATTNRVKAALMLDADLKTQTILVDTVAGTVRLTGEVSSTAGYDRAKDVVKVIEGVKAVDNQLVVREIRPQ